MTRITDKLYAQSKNGNNFYKLYNLIICEDNILLAYRNIKRNTGSNTKGTDGKTVKDYANMSMDEMIQTVQKRLANFQPMSVRRVFIPKTNGKERPLGIPTFEDRLIQQCIKQILEPICEAKFHPHSYGFRPLRSTKYAISRMMTLAQVRQYYYCVDIDIKGFFDNIDHGKLIKQMWSLGIRDKRILSIISKMLKAEIVGEGIPEKGTPQGGILSPLLSNIVLNELDWWISSQYETIRFNGNCNPHSVQTQKSHTNLKQIYIVRYADDFKIMCKTHNEAIKAFNATKNWLKERLNLDISKEKSKIVNLRKQYSEFLGFKIKLIKRRNKYVIRSHISDKSKQRIKQMLKKTIKSIDKNGENSVKKINQINSQIIGLHQYYSTATMINHDFGDIAYELSYLIERKLNPIAKRGKFKQSCSKYITETYLKRNNYFTYKIGKAVLIPMVYISHKKPMNFSQDMNVYSEDGRNKSGYKKLVLEGVLKDRWKIRSKYDDVELLDNSISKISSQQLICAISKLFIIDGEIHHITPKEMGGDDSYSNLLYVDRNVHKLIHIKDEKIIRVYINYFKKIISNYSEFINSLNKYRQLAGNEIINLSV
ncbi:MAG: group II intron reverse transcriptase/maturase [Oscillospiraceae bacterium]|nr:group II intron reverse transcriptase/maturase [Oscillospiraceae bacterium]